ncbi:MAG TPA: hypothetical protein VF228_17790, partial [Iamia sp.]
SDLDVLVGRFGDRPIFLGRAIQNYLNTSAECLLYLARELAANETPSIVVLQSLLRPVLMASGRVVFILGSTDRKQQFTNASIVMRQEGDSYLRALRAFSGFEHLRGFVAPSEVMAEVEAAVEKLRQGAPKRGEGQVLDEMAEFIAQEVGAREQGRVMSDSVTHAWHTFSGGAHGYVWPDNVPGDFIATFGVVVPVAHWAFDIAVTRTHV